MFHSRRQKLSVDDINAALKHRNMDPLYGFEPTEPLAFRAVPNTGLFYVPSDELDIETILQEPMPRAPQPMCLTSHWLAIEGIQPQIPQNPIIPDRNAIGEVSNPAASKAETNILPGKRDVTEDAEIKPLVKHVLSKELQLYYDTLISDLLDGSAQPATEYSPAALSAIAALKNDAGIQQLLPYFVQFIAETVPKSLFSGLRLMMAMDVTGSLLHNEHLFIEPYLHQLMPAVLTCVVGKRLGEPDFDHWSLRLQAGELVSFIANAYGNTYTTLLPRVTKTLARALSTSEDGGEVKPLTTHFGAIVTLTLLGPNVVDSVLLPMAESYMELLKSVEEGAVEVEREKVVLAWRNAFEQWKEHFGADADERKLRIINKFF